MNSNCSENNVNDLLNSMLQKHYSMWLSLRNNENLCSIKTLLMSELETIGGMDGDKSLVALHEYLEMITDKLNGLLSDKKFMIFSRWIGPCQYGTVIS